MDIQNEAVGNVCVVTTQGRLDGNASTTFAARLEPLIGAQSNFLLDFSGVEFVTSAGLRAILTILKKIKSSNGAVAMCCVQTQVREILDITGLTPMMQIYTSRSDGLAALSK